MSKMPKHVKEMSFSKRLDWRFSGFSYAFSINRLKVLFEPTLRKFRHWEMLKDLVYHLRDRKYEHIVIEFADDRSANFIQTAKHGKLYRLEYSHRLKSGKSILSKCDVNARDCAIILFQVCFENAVPFEVIEAIKWSDITNEIKSNYSVARY